MNYTENGINRIINQYNDLTAICRFILGKTHIPVIADVDVLYICNEHCGEPSNASMWINFEPCIVVKYRFCSSSQWERFNIPLRWVKSEKAVKKGIKEYVDRIEGSLKNARLRELDSQIDALEQELIRLKHRREEVDNDC